MLPTYVRIHDVNDVEGFVAATLERSPIRRQISESEREDLIAEGICIMHELGSRFESRRAGYATAGRFSGFAAAFLPKRLGDAWHSSHPEHRRLTAADGSRNWTYESPPISLDGEEAPEVVAREELQSDIPGLRAALATIEPYCRPAIRLMAEMVLDGYGWDEIADKLERSRVQIAWMRDRLGQALEEVHREAVTA